MLHHHSINHPSSLPSPSLLPCQPQPSRLSNLPRAPLFLPIVLAKARYAYPNTLLPWTHRLLVPQGFNHNLRWSSPCLPASNDHPLHLSSFPYSVLPEIFVRVPHGLASNPFLVTLLKSRLTAHIHSFVYVFFSPIEPTSSILFFLPKPHSSLPGSSIWVLTPRN